MNLRGRRVHIAGSVGDAADPEKVRYAHRLVGELTRELATRGAHFLAQAGKEPRMRQDPTLPASVFDWTVIEAVHDVLTTGHATAGDAQGRLFASVATHKTDAQIPEPHRFKWQELLTADAVHLAFVEGGWTAGALRRVRQTSLGDVLIAVSGGEGTEHLVQEYRLQHKPVIPLDLDLGSSCNDGNGGAARFFGKMAYRPKNFIETDDDGAIGAIVSRMGTKSGTKPVGDVVAAIFDLLVRLLPPAVFYVRLDNPNVAEFASVNRYFRNVVDPVIRGYGYRSLEMGRTRPTNAWINPQIFDFLHRASVVITDLSASRHNCFMEMGYAFGLNKRVLVTARDDTDIPFDPKPLDICKWSEGANDTDRIQQLQDYWHRNTERPPLYVPSPYEQKRKLQHPGGLYFGGRGDFRPDSW